MIRKKKTIDQIPFQIHSLLTSPTADQTIAKMEKLLMTSVGEEKMKENGEE